MKGTRDERAKLPWARLIAPRNTNQTLRRLPFAGQAAQELVRKERPLARIVAPDLHRGGLGFVSFDSACTSRRASSSVALRNGFHSGFAAAC